MGSDVAFPYPVYPVSLFLFIGPGETIYRLQNPWGVLSRGFFARPVP
ncbi:hypothetical protein THTE_0246 [Thermogutta terrifontis]|uniref:Uncharacterized protein n=1 Tax=Thermogutta terrifontis TaxID=1331910 RepID=A0A286RA58_9BACT|nr:hypothetical protein THTE_0246 [Thermogutta terrifontis]